MTDLRVAEALLHDSNCDSQWGRFSNFYVQESVAHDFGLPSSAIRLRM